LSTYGANFFPLDSLADEFTASVAKGDTPRAPGPKGPITHGDQGYNPSLIGIPGDAKSLQRDSSLPPLTAAVVDEYHPIPPDDNIILFNSVFPLAPHQFAKWKQGVRLWPAKKWSIIPYSARHESIASDTIVERFLKSGIISPARRGPYRSNLFLVPKGENRVRPVLDYSHLTRCLPCPKFVLPNLSQLVTRKGWQKDLFYVKLDFKNAFFNIAIHPKSKHITAFCYRKKLYQFNVLPFGISIAPYVMQTHLNAILRFIKSVTPYTWGHIDDLILGHADPLVLKKLVRDLLFMLTKVLWRLNLKKCVLVPVKKITFLGSEWGPTRVQRSQKVTQQLLSIWNMIESKILSGKILQRVQGFFNYYLNFYGNFHAFINRVLIHPFNYRFKSLILFLIEKDFLLYNTHTIKPFKTFCSDATMIGVGYCSGKEISFKRRTPFTPILVNEWRAASLAIARFTSSKSLVKHFILLLRIDNKAVVSLVNYGRCKWNVSLRDVTFVFYNLSFPYIKYYLYTTKN
jgi:hypothetical protein